MASTDFTDAFLEDVAESAPRWSAECLPRPMSSQVSHMVSDGAKKERWACDVADVVFDQSHEIIRGRLHFFF